MGGGGNGGRAGVWMVIGMMIWIVAAVGISLGLAKLAVRTGRLAADIRAASAGIFAGQHRAS